MRPTAPMPQGAFAHGKGRSSLERPFRLAEARGRERLELVAEEGLEPPTLGL